MNALKEFRKQCEKIAGSYASLLEESNHADLALPCFALAKELKKNPIEIANELAKEFSLKKAPLIKNIKSTGPYVNFYIDEKVFSKEVLKQILKEKGKYGSGKNKEKIMVEYAHPNTHKLFHIGHLRNITTGEALARILSFSGSKVVRANYQGDVGMHIAKCLWGINKISEQNKAIGKIFKSKNIYEKIRFLGKAYATGSKVYEESAEAKKEIIEINKQIYRKDKKILKLWKTTRQWSLDYFGRIYKRVYTKFDRLYFESEVADKGLKISKQLVKKGILKESENAVIFDGTPYNLDKRVFVNKHGFPTYEGKELGLAETEFSEYKLGKCIHLTGPEQTSFFNVCIKVQELMNSKKFQNKQHHIVYGWVRLREGKMSSRLGNVIEGEWLLDELKKAIIEKYPDSKKQAEEIAIAAAKYYFLKVSTPTEISFDINEAVSLEGNTGPYLQYTYARTNTLLKKAKKKPKIGLLKDELEKNLIKKLAEFPSIIEKSAKEMKPNLVANYAFDLSALFNEYYQKSRIIDSEKEQERLSLAQAVKIVIENSLTLLGIKPLQEM